MKFNASLQSSGLKNGQWWAWKQETGWKYILIQPQFGKWLRIWSSCRSHWANAGKFRSEPSSLSILLGPLQPSVEIQASLCRCSPPKINLFPNRLTVEEVIWYWLLNLVGVKFKSLFVGFSRNVYWCVISELFVRFQSSLQTKLKFPSGSLAKCITSPLTQQVHF